MEHPCGSWELGRNPRLAPWDPRAIRKIRRHTTATETVPDIVLDVGKLYWFITEKTYVIPVGEPKFACRTEIVVEGKSHTIFYWKQSLLVLESQKVADHFLISGAFYEVIES